LIFTSCTTQKRLLIKVAPRVFCNTGNDNLHLLTSGKRQQLRVDLDDFEGNSRYAEYDNFKVDSACTQYKLTSLGTYTGNAGCLGAWPLLTGPYYGRPV